MKPGEVLLPLFLAVFTLLTAPVVVTVLYISLRIPGLAVASFCYLLLWWGAARRAARRSRDPMHRWPAVAVVLIVDLVLWAGPMYVYLFPSALWGHGGFTAGRALLADTLAWIAMLAAYLLGIRRTESRTFPAP